MLTDLWQTSATKNAGNGATDAPGVALLTDVRVLTFTGADVLEFLQGYLTCDLGELEDGAGARAPMHATAMTNIKGRVVANGWVRQRDTETDAGTVNSVEIGDSVEVVDWIVHASLAEPVVGFLAPYLAFSRTTLEQRADDHLVVGLTDRDLPRIRIIDDEASLEELLASHQVIEETAYRLACIDAGIVLISQATSERFLPQMLGLVDIGAVDFDKGCYLGQEVVARAQHRGEVKRKLHRFSGEGAGATAEPGTRLTDGSGRETGTLLSVSAVADKTVSAVAAGSDNRYRCLAVAPDPVASTQHLNTDELTLET